jgi:hypothetical protein
LPKYEYCRYRKILGNTGYTSIADTGRFRKILVISVLQILENTGYTSIADIGRLGRIPVNPGNSSIWQFDTSGQSLILTVNHSSLYLPLVLGSAQSCQITLRDHTKYLPVLLDEEY